MEIKEIILKLLELGWMSRPYHRYDEKDFYLYKVFEISQAKELYHYTDYVPLPGERIYVAYELYPNLETAHWCIWSEYDEPSSINWDFDDYETVLKLALEDKLFTYPHWVEKLNKEENL